MSPVWRSMTSNDQYLAECFKKSLLIAFKKQRNLREHLMRATLPPNERHKQILKVCSNVADNALPVQILKKEKQ